jgi:hypothetical protein
MEPTERERNQANKVVTELNECADALTAGNDILREYLLGERTLELPQMFKFADMPPRIWDKIAKLKAQHKNTYAPARSNRVPGLINHVENLARDYDRLMEFVRRERVLTKGDYEWIQTQQNEHREADLRRLMKVFGDNGDRQRLKKVLDADNTKPLEPQLGFSPDDF